MWSEVKMKPILGSRKSVAWLLPLGVPPLMWLATCFFAYQGNIIGRVFCSALHVSWLFVGAYFGLKLGLCIRHQAKKQLLIWGFGIVICLIGFGWTYRTKPFLTIFESKLRQSCELISVQKWAVGVLSTNGARMSLSTSVWSDMAAGTHFDHPNGIYVVNDKPQDKTGYVKILWGSGAVGQWGLIVGAAELPKFGREWAPGVYFFVNPKPSGWRE